jgi:hypothetical protein
VSFVKIRSWHVIRLTRSLEPRTLCGRVAPRSAETSDTLPLTDKSCESCARLVLKSQGETS